MKLYFLPGTCALADHIVLEWIGQPFEAIKLERADLRSREYLQLNPSGVVPTLVDDDGWVLTENAAILNYLLDRFPEAGLGGDNSPRARATVNRWLAFINTDVHKAFAPLFSPGRFHPDDTQHDALKQRARERIRELLAIVDTHLADRDWLADHKSPADAYLHVIVRWTHKTGVDLSGYEHLARHTERLRADAGVKRALEAQGLG